MFAVLASFQNLENQRHAEYLVTQMTAVEDYNYDCADILSKPELGIQCRTPICDNAAFDL